MAPVNTISITKLELSAAQLLTRLIDYISPSLETKPVEIQCWSDSRNVLCMLKISPAKLKVFEAIRVSEIITTLPKVRWKYVPTSENPSDCATRGLSAEALKSFSLWLSGPSWLQDKLQWPSQLDLEQISAIALNASLLAIKSKENSCLDKFQSFSKLVRAIACGRRWINYKQGKTHKNMLQPLSAEESRIAREKIIRFDQLRQFPLEIENLSKKGSFNDGARSRDYAPYWIPREF